MYVKYICQKNVKLEMKAVFIQLNPNGQNCHIFIYVNIMINEENNKIGIDGHYSILSKNNWKKDNYLSIGDYHK